MAMELTPEYLRDCCTNGMTDSEIGSIFGMTGEGIAYRRNKIGISVLDKYNKKREDIKRLNQTDTWTLREDYYRFNQKGFSNKYGVSKIVWMPLLKERGILGKALHRIESYPPFTVEQRSLIIGSLLGDGSVSQKNFFYESHSLKQEFYLRHKSDILKPYSRKIYSCDNNTGLRFKTVYHPNFNEFYDNFYKVGITGKLIPVDFIRTNWQETILFYWFFDDGYYDRKRNELTIANKCPDYDMLKEFVEFLDDKFKWKFTIWKKSDMYFVTFSKKFYKDFSKLLLNIATPDLFYKIP